MAYPRNRSVPEIFGESRASIFFSQQILSAQFLDTKTFTSVWENFYKLRKAPQVMGKEMVTNETGVGSAWYRRIGRFGGNGIGIAGQSVDETENN